jgi:hypothetical protein
MMLPAARWLKTRHSMRIRPIVATTLAFFAWGLAFASEENVDGDRLSECYGIYDAMVGLGEAGKIPAQERARFEAQRARAESLALEKLKSEGLSEELAREQLEGHSLYMRSELREIREGGVGIYNIAEMRKLALACDPLMGQ